MQQPRSRSAQRRRIASAEITRRVDLPILGVIPHTDDVEEEEDIGDLRRMFMTRADSLMGEAFRQIRT
ncbi:MAG: hypothetical protein V3S18_05535, partial [Dehalococcoidia bacterium]